MTALSAPLHPWFPLRAAGIDIGSNAMRFIAAEFSSPTRFQVLESKRVPVRLGASVFRDGRLDPKALAASLRALAFFRRRLQALQITHYRAIATSAVRESKNRRDFLRLAEERLKLAVDVVSGSEEARLVVRAVRQLQPLGSKPWLVMNLGGGSLELCLADQDRIHWSESHTLGTVRLLAELGAPHQPPQNLQRLVKDYLKPLRTALTKASRPLAGIVATGGNSEVLARLAGAPQLRPGMRVLRLNALGAITRRLARLTVEQRIRTLGLRPDRADVILPAALVHDRIGRLGGKRQILVSDWGTKEGLLLDVVARLFPDERHDQEREQELFRAALALGRHYRIDEAHCRQVTRLAMSIFEQLRSLHQLRRDDGRLLMAASLLHDVGGFVSLKKHHKHSLYLVLQSELPGCTESDMLMIANVARYHRKSHPQLRHEHFARLSSDDQRRVAVLASLLRLADALDRDHTQNVRAAAARIEKNALVLSLEGRRIRPLEVWSLKRKARLFTDLFGYPVRLEYLGRPIHG
ncbi:MAG: Ppx/GppA phosphatase family protein [candidate division FCPU426 bacterium]